MSKIRAKKSLGQHFLNSDKLLQKIVEAGRVGPSDIILEIGPGYGNLTEKLLQKSGKVITVEKDGRLISFLEKKFQDDIASGKLEVINADILELDPIALTLDSRPYKIIANLPYYITGKFLRKFLEEENRPSLMVLMLQKEVVMRIVGQNRNRLPQKESILSISVKAFGSPKYIQTVKKGSFRPQPKVDSAILLIDELNGNFFEKINSEKFFSIIKAGFSKKRKKLSSNLKEFGTKEELEKKFKVCNLTLNIRAENLSLENWRCLASKLISLKTPESIPP